MGGLNSLLRGLLMVRHGIVLALLLELVGQDVQLLGHTGCCALGQGGAAYWLCGELFQGTTGGGGGDATGQHEDLACLNVQQFLEALT